MTINQTGRQEAAAVEIDPSVEIPFTFDGRTYTGYAGDTIASALYRAGVRVFSRSFKYHRPRGLLCVSGACPNCLVNLDGTPNVTACTARVKPHMSVASQNVWPSLKRDLMGVFDRLDRFLPVGFYYKRFVRPRTLWPAYETILRHAAGLGVIDPDPERFQEPYYDKEYLAADVAVVGGGPAGMSAALAAADLGANVILIDNNLRLGGHLCYQRSDLDNTVAQRASDLPAAIQAHPDINWLASTTAFGWYEGNVIGAAQGNRLIKLRVAELIVAMGRIEQPLVFGNNDLPGVMLGSGVQRLLNLYAVRPGRRVLVVTANNAGWTVARDLLLHDVKVALVVDARPEIPQTDVVRELRAAGVAGLASHTIQAAQGKRCVQGAVVVRLDQSGNPVPGTEITLKCDLISLSTGFVPNNALLYQSGCQLHYDAHSDSVIPFSFAPGVRGAGQAAGTQGLEAILVNGQVAGIEAALALARVSAHAAQGGSSQIGALRGRMKELQEEQRSGAAVRPLPSVSAVGKKGFVCFCEDVTAKDIADAVTEGFDDIETLKRYSTVSMGPCQGKMCGMNATRLCAQETGRTVATIGTTTARPPFTPVKLGILAGRKLEPVRYTPIHARHLSLGAKMMNAGQWKRPESYGDPTHEVQTVRTQLGMIDVSTLGKVDVQGPDALPFLERIYTGRLADLDVGQARYGLMCTEEGIILDDGVVSRVAQEHYYLTTSSGGIDGVYEWLTWWLVTWNLQAHVTNVTSAYAAVNVAGPRARDLLSQLTEIDLGAERFPYLHVRTGPLAGVPTRWLRLGFVGELGYEIHYPAAYGEYVWDALLEAGAAFNMVPFGIEAQRVLRLEKGHIIVGQDTDALSDPFGAGLAWAVRLDKGDFVGRRSLERRQARGPRDQLVGFQMSDASPVPGEGAQIVGGDRFIGRVTSARYSPTLGRTIGLGWVPPEKSHAGTEIQIRTHHALAQATVTAIPFYDPKGLRLRS